MKRRRFLEKLALTGGAGVSFSYATPNLGPNPSRQTNADKKLTSIQVTVPSTISLGEDFWIGIRLLTQPFFTHWIPVWQRNRATVNGPFNQSARGIHYMENVIPSWNKEVEIIGDEGFEGRNRYSFKEGNGPYEGDHRPVRRLEGFRFTQPGIKYIRVRDPETGITGVSNPIVVTSEKPDYRLFWGNLHCHSIFGDGIRIPEEIHAFARDESFLDVFALTDHTEAITKGQWTYFNEVANDFYEPGRYVTFIGGEWTSPQYGHRNFIYPGNSGPILRCTDPNQDTLQKLYAIARAEGALIVANHTASFGHTTHWDNGHDPETERLIEIYSIGGINEMMFGLNNLSPNRRKDQEVERSHAIDGLKRGFKLGFIGTGDDHDGRPGDSLHHLQEKPESYKFLRGPGLMGVWAEDLTRESVFKALWNRRVYGTTNNRTWLKFSINGNPMGSDFQTQQNLTLKIEAAGSTKIQRVDLVKEGEVVHSRTMDQWHLNWDLKENRPNKPTWYYVRLKLEDDHAAWSSPIWITPE